MSKRHSIEQGTAQDHRYRCFTADEMTYLIWTRSASTVNGTPNARWCNAYVNSMYGFILLPNTFTLPSGITMNDINVDKKTSPTNNYTVAQWEELEAAGCIFLPACGVAWGSNGAVNNLGAHVYVWLSTVRDDGDGQGYCPHVLTVRSNRFTVNSYKDRINRLGVRLLDENGDGFSIAPNKQVGITRGNLQYHPLNDEWRIAPNAYEVIGSPNSDFRNASHNGWLDLFGWGGSGWSGGVNNYWPAGPSLSSNNADCYAGGDIQQSATGAYANCDWGVYNNNVIQD